jgi:hypothetical protein
MIRYRIKKEEIIEKTENWYVRKIIVGKNIIKLNKKKTIIKKDNSQIKIIFINSRIIIWWNI